jgi:hypothetical protein
MPARGAVTFNTIALSGATGSDLGYGPGFGEGVHFSGFGGPRVNSSGQIAFRGELTGPGLTSTNSTGIWTRLEESLQLVARTGVSELGPGVEAGVTFQTLHDPSFNDAGHVKIRGILTGSGINPDNNEGVWHNASGEMVVAAREGSSGPGPNLGPGVNFSEIGGSVLNPAGTFVLLSGLGGATTGLWSNLGGALNVFALEHPNGPGPNIGPGVQFQEVILPTINASSKMVFRATVSGTGIDATNDTGVWTYADGNLTCFLREGIGGPGPNVGEGLYFGNIDRPVVTNNLGEIAFGGWLTGTSVSSSNNAIVWTNAGGSAKIVAREGTSDAGPNLGPGIFFGDLPGAFPGNVFNNVLLNSHSDMAFAGTVTGAGVDIGNDSGIWAYSAESLVNVAREGTALGGPNLGDGVFFGQLFSFNGTSGVLFMNGENEIVFQAGLKGNGIDSTNDSGVWAWSNGELMKIAREGDLFDVNPSPFAEDLRTIGTIAMNSGAQYGNTGEEGGSKKINGNGLLIFALYFTDGTSGIFTAQLPRQPGDFDNDGDVDGADFVAWQTNFPLASGATLATGDADGDGDVDGADFVVWQTHFPTSASGATSPVPEPAAGVLALIALVATGWLLRTQHSHPSSLAKRDGVEAA